MNEWMNIFILSLSLSFIRIFNIVYQKDTFVNGIPAYRFIPEPTLFRSPSHGGAMMNKCFCSISNDQTRWCDGVFNLTKCLGTPLAYSWPHFLDASPKIQNSVVGLKPDRHRHQAYIDVEPASYD